METDLNTLEWFRHGFETYNPIPDVLPNIKNKLKNYTIDLIIDVDCVDVQLLIPKLVKTLCLCNINNYNVYHIDMKNLPIKMDDNQTVIEKVPTIIFSDNKREQLRISEKIVYSNQVEKEIEYILATMNTNSVVNKDNLVN